MYKIIEVNNNIRMDFIVGIIIALRWSLAGSAGHLWYPAELENVANPDFGNLKHLQNPGHLLLTAPSIKSAVTSVNNNIVLTRVSILSKTQF